MINENGVVLVQQVKINTDYITLQQLLKMIQVISSGGEAKYFLQEHQVFVNDQLETRRGRKLYPGDQVKIDGMLVVIHDSAN